MISLLNHWNNLDILLQEIRLLKDYSQQRKTIRFISLNVLEEEELNIITKDTNVSFMVIVRVLGK